MTWPAYLGLAQSGELDRRVQRATKRLERYSPCYRAREIPELARPLASREYQQALATARAVGLERLAR